VVRQERCRKLRHDHDGQRVQGADLVADEAEQGRSGEVGAHPDRGHHGHSQRGASRAVGCGADADGEAESRTETPQHDPERRCGGLLAEDQQQHAVSNARASALSRRTTSRQTDVSPASPAGQAGSVVRAAATPVESRTTSPVRNW
jgi:hypothetical protein